MGSKELSKLIRTKKTKGGKEKMCRAITELIEGGKAEGREEGKREERANTRREKTTKMRMFTMTIWLF